MEVRIDYEALFESTTDLIRQASTQLPADIRRSLEKARDNERNDSCRSALLQILENIALAEKNGTPICQDTGYPTFVVDLPEAYEPGRVREVFKRALRTATKRSLLRPNAVDILSGKNTGNNNGLMYPAVYFNETDSKQLSCRLLLKGGGSENVSTQFKLPDASLSAGRDLEGVRKGLLNAVHQAQGFGCSPGVLGVSIGGDRAQGYALAKKQLLRPLTDKNDVKELAELEDTVLGQANSLGIGPMGFGGDTTLLGVKIGHAHRHPASFFVTVAYGCWALRRKTLRFDGQEGTIED